MEQCLCCSRMGASVGQAGDMESLRTDILRAVGNAGELLLSQPIPVHKMCLIPITKGLERGRLVIIQEGLKMRWGKLSPVECDPCTPLLLSPWIHLG